MDSYLAAPARLAELDMTVLLVIFLSKALVAAACVGFGRATLGTMHGRASLSHAAMYAMAASHSFDVTLGIPLATELFPAGAPEAHDVALYEFPLLMQSSVVDRHAVERPEVGDEPRRPVPS